MTEDRLDSYNQELKDIRDKFLDFSTLVLAHSMSYIDTTVHPKAANGTVLDIAFWNNTEED